MEENLFPLFLFLFSSTRGKVEEAYIALKSYAILTSVILTGLTSVIFFISFHLNLQYTVYLKTYFPVMRFYTIMWQLSAISAKNTLAEGNGGEHIRPASLLLFINMLLLLIVHQSKYYTLHSDNII